jgi:hypothetical protein
MRAQQLALGTDVDITRAVIDKVAGPVVRGFVLPIRQGQVRLNAHILERLSVFHRPIGRISGQLLRVQSPAEADMPS